MKTITIEIDNKAYPAFRKFLKTLPKDSFKIYDDDVDTLTNNEKKEINLLMQETDKNNYHQFDDWDEISKSL